MPKDRCAITSIKNEADKKSGVLPQVKTANISGFQFLKIFNLKHTLLNNLRICIY